MCAVQPIAGAFHVIVPPADRPVSASEARTVPAEPRSEEEAVEGFWQFVDFMRDEMAVPAWPHSREGWSEVFPELAGLDDEHALVQVAPPGEHAGFHGLRRAVDVFGKGAGDHVARGHLSLRIRQKAITTSGSDCREGLPRRC